MFSVGEKTFGVAAAISAEGDAKGFQHRGNASNARGPMK
jgi:hypothetical protein